MLTREVIASGVVDSGASRRRGVTITQVSPARTRCWLFFSTHRTDCFVGRKKTNSSWRACSTSPGGCAGPFVCRCRMTTSAFAPLPPRPPGTPAVIWELRGEWRERGLGVTRGFWGVLCVLKQVNAPFFWPALTAVPESSLQALIVPRALLHSVRHTCSFVWLVSLLMSTALTTHR